MLDGTLREFTRCTTVHDVMTDNGDEYYKLGVGECAHLALETRRHARHWPYVHAAASVDMESLSTEVKEAVLMADLEEKPDKLRSIFCGLRKMLLSVSGHDQIGKKTNCRQEKNLKKGVDDHDVKMKKTEQIEIGKMRKTDEGVSSVLDEGKKVGKNECVWYLGFASLPVEEEDE